MNTREFHDRWYDEAQITDADDAGLFEWLEEQTPDDWHAIISNWNYDRNNAALIWIVSHPKCDMGTAIQLFLTGVLSWSSYNREDLEPYYYDSFDTVEIARERLKTMNFENKELVPSITDSPDEILPDYPSIIKTYKGIRGANSDFMSQDGTIYFTQKVFAEKIGIDYSMILNSLRKERKSWFLKYRFAIREWLKQNSLRREQTKHLANPYSKFQIAISVIVILTMLLALVFL